MLQYNEIREKKIIIYNDEPCEVVESHVARTQQRKPQNQVKLKSLISGKTFAATFHVSDMADEADITKKEVIFLYENRGEYWFCRPEDKGDRFKLNVALAGEAAKFLKQNSNVTALVWTDEDGEVPTEGRGSSTLVGEKIIKLALPIKMEFKVKEAAPAVRGDTAKGGNKTVTLENGATLNVPMFINEGDTIRINTETGEYVERA